MTNNPLQKFNELYKQLNDKQKEAVEAIDGPVLVLAGPGTGKTQILTMRIANILTKTDTDPDAILALTFTDSGVRAMKERLISIIGEDAYHVNIYTFHSFASDIIQSNPDYFLDNGVLEPLSDIERVYIFKEIFDQLEIKNIKPFSAPYFYLYTAISKIKELKREGISPKDFAIAVKSQTETKEFKEYDINKNKELSEVYELYQQKLKEHRRYDFEDMINFVIQKFENDPEFLAKYIERFQYFLVDEFQDTNNAQSRLLYILNSHWGEQSNLFVVGDDDQSIYRFQGASTENIHEFLRRYPNAKVINLEKNYRSKQYILDSSHTLIDKNETRINKILNISKKLEAVKPSDKNQQINVIEFSSSYIESYFIASEIKRLISEENVNPDEIAVIYRNNADAQLLSEILGKLNVKYQIQGGQNILESGLIIRLMHLFNVIYKIRNKDEDLDLFTLFNYEFLGFDSLDVLKLVRFASEKQKNLFDILDDQTIDLSGIKHIQKFQDFKTKLIGWNYDSVNMTFIDFVQKILSDSGFLRWVLDQRDNYRKLNILNSFFSEIKRLNQSDRELTLEKFIKHIGLMNENRIPISEQDLEIDSNSIHLMTAHKSKGLEYEYVFIPYFVDGKWSNVRSRDLIKFPPAIIEKIVNDFITSEDTQIEDERRLLYVTLTRAKSKIYITSSKSYITNNSSKDVVMCMYLSDIHDGYINRIDQEKFEFQNIEILKTILSMPDVNSSISDDEKIFLESALINFKLSATALNTYLECPYKFKLDILFKTPRPREKQLILGTVVHGTLEAMYKEIVKGKQIDFEKIPEIFKKKLDSEIIRESEYQEIYEQGIFILNRYIDTYKDELTNPKDKILFLEKYFGFNFDMPRLDSKILLQGKIDKTILLNDEEREVRIVDYKTGKPSTKNQILGKTKDSDGSLYRQLLFYSLLLSLNRNNRYDVVEMQLDFTGDRKTKPVRVDFTKPNDNDIEELKDTIRSVWSKIHEYNFERTKDYSPCFKCKYRQHCWPDGIPSNIEE